MTSVSLFCFFGIFCAVTGILLRESAPRFLPVFAVGSGVVFLFAGLKIFSPFLEYFRSFSEKAGNGSVLFRGLGIAVLVSVTADLCRDLGEKSTAEKVEFCGKAVLTLTALPLLKSLFEFLEAMG